MTAPPRDRTAARELLLTCAYRAMLSPNLSVEDDLTDASPLDQPALHTAFCELIAALHERDDLADGSKSWVDTHQDLIGVDRDGQALDAASVRVEDALDALLGGAS